MPGRHVREPDRGPPGGPRPATEAAGRAPRPAASRPVSGGIHNHRGVHRLGPFPVPRSAGVAPASYRLRAFPTPRERRCADLPAAALDRVDRTVGSPGSLRTPGVGRCAADGDEPGELSQQPRGLDPLPQLAGLSSVRLVPARTTPCEVAVVHGPATIAWRIATVGCQVTRSSPPAIASSRTPGGTLGTREHLGRRGEDVVLAVVAR